jgi:hypothetical protein
LNRICTLKPGSLLPLAKLASLRDLKLTLCEELEVQEVEQLLSSAVQGAGLTIRIQTRTLMRKRRPSSPSPPSLRNPDYVELPSQPSGQEYKDAHSRVVAARGVARTPHLIVEQPFADYVQE